MKEFFVDVVLVLKKRLRLRIERREKNVV